MKSLLASLVLLAGCAGAAAPAPAGAPEHAGTDGAAASAPAAPAGATEERLVLVPVRTRGAALFPEETEELRRAELAFFTARPEVGKDRIVPLDQVRAVEGAAKGGRARFGGPVCAAAPDVGDAIGDAFPGMPQARAVAACDRSGACSLHISVVRPSAGSRGETLAVFEAPVAAPASPAEWRAAFGHLALSKGRTGALTGAAAVDRPANPVRVLAVNASGPWAAPPDAAALAPAQAALDACHDPDAGRATRAEVALAVGADGRVARCQADAPAASDCYCKALSGVTFAAAPAGRRLAVGLWSAPAAPMTTAAGLTMRAHFEGARAADDTSVDRALAGATTRLAVCRALDPSSGTLRGRLHLRVDAQGHVQSARVSGLGGTVATCVEANAKRIALPCPRAGAPTGVTATLVLDASR